MKIGNFLVCLIVFPLFLQYTLLPLIDFSYQEIRVNEWIPYAPLTAQKKSHSSGLKAVGEIQVPQVSQCTAFNTSLQKWGGQPWGAKSSGAESPLYYLFSWLIKKNIYMCVCVCVRVCMHMLSSSGIYYLGAWIQKREIRKRNPSGNMFIPPRSRAKSSPSRLNKVVF